MVLSAHLRAEMIPRMMESTLIHCPVVSKVHHSRVTFNIYANCLDIGEDCGTVAPAHVISTSYSYNEADLTPFYTARQCAEYAKVRIF
jgi:hypothetical protein